MVTVAVTIGLALAVMPALAADTVTVTASNFNFSPAAVTIRVGDTVRFANSGGFHNFVFDDGPEYPDGPTEPGPAWNDLSRTFTQPGTYPFVCGAHAPRGTRAAPCSRFGRCAPRRRRSAPSEPASAGSRV